jgi:hypothetical protein
LNAPPEALDALWNDSFRSGTAVYDDGTECESIAHFDAPPDGEPAEVGAKLASETLDATQDTKGNVYYFRVDPSGGSQSCASKVASSQWHLVTITSAGTARELAAVTSPRGITTSARDQIVISAAVNGKQGMWLLGANGAEPRLLAAGSFDQLAFSPDGSKIAAVREDDSDGNTALVTVNLPS